MFTKIDKPYRLAFSAETRDSEGTISGMTFQNIYFTTTKELAEQLTAVITADVISVEIMVKQLPVGGNKIIQDILGNIPQSRDCQGALHESSVCAPKLR